MSAADIKTTHDRAIVRLAHEGLSAIEIANSLGVERAFVRWRANRLGVYVLIIQTSQRKRAERRERRLNAKGRWIGYRGSRAAEGLIATRVDRSASDLTRALKADRIALESFDATSLVACFHSAGLTLEDIEVRLGVPPIQAVAAIRSASCGLRL